MEYLRIAFDLLIAFFSIDFWFILYSVSLAVWLITTLFPNIVLNLIRKPAAFAIGFITLIRGIHFSYKLALFLDYQFSALNFFLNIFIDRSGECIFCFKWGFIYAYLLALGLFIVFYELSRLKFVKKN